MYRYPSKTNVDKSFSFDDIYRLIGRTETVEKDMDLVESIELSNILSADTTNYEPSENVLEIYVMSIVLKHKVVPKLLLESLDKSINFHVLFKVVYETDIYYYASLKENADDKLKILKSFESGWISPTKDNLPAVQKLEDIYRVMISAITHVKFASTETFKQYIAKFNTIKKISGEIEKLTKARDSEKQPNTKMAINGQIKVLKRELQEMEK